MGEFRHTLLSLDELVPTVAIHALRKLIAGGKGQYSLGNTGQRLTRPPPPPLFTHAAVRDVRRSVPYALREYRAVLQIHDQLPESRPVASLNQAQTHLTRPVATGVGMQRAPDTYVRSAAYDQSRDM